MPSYTPEEYENAQNCYQMAYSLLPHYLTEKPQKVFTELSAGRIGAMFFYVMACQMNQREPDVEIVKAFDVQSGTLSDGYDYFVIVYPTPPPVDISLEMSSSASLEQITETMKNVILAPYFSAIIVDKRSRQFEYFILGQSPNGQTTFRTVTPEGNFNLGPGCVPDLESFLELLRKPTPSPRAGVLSSAPAKTRQKRWWEFWR